MYTLKPASRTHRAKRATCGVMPGISVMTMTAGPSPATKTRFARSRSVTSRASKSSSGSCRVRTTSVLDRSHREHFELIAGDVLQRVELAVHESGVRLALEVIVRAVVREDHAVLLHRLCDDLRLRREARRIERLLQAN